VADPAPLSGARPGLGPAEARADGSPPGPRAPQGPQRPRPPAAGLALPLGLLVLVVAVGLLPDLSANVRLPAALVGLFLAHVGLDALARRVLGPQVEVGLWLAIGWLALVVLAAVFADLLPLAEARNPAQTLGVASRQRPDLFSAHPLGTDKQGLDMLGGVVYGARVSLHVSLLAVLIGTVVGGCIGTVAGYFRGWFDGLVGTATDTVLAFPPLILLLAIVTVMAADAWNISVALAVLTIPTYIRLARANTLTYAQREFVLAARAVGARSARIILRELLPNVVRPMLSYSFVIVAVLIVAEASLSFLGVGIRPPTPTWGNMIAGGQLELERAPHLVLVPGTVMFLTVFALNRVGDKARELWDPRDAAL
jgi:peptide/nickel transport system permease protein